MRISFFFPMGLSTLKTKASGAYSKNSVTLFWCNWLCLLLWPISGNISRFCALTFQRIGAYVHAN